MRSYCHGRGLLDPVIRTERELSKSEIENGGAKFQCCVPADAVAMRWPCRRGRDESGENATARVVHQVRAPTVSLSVSQLNHEHLIRNRQGTCNKMTVLYFPFACTVQYA